jgi:hypothetical protein
MSRASNSNQWKGLNQRPERRDVLVLLRWNVLSRHLRCTLDNRTRIALALIEPKRSTSDDSKTASRDPAAVRAPHPDIWRLWLPPMPPPGS